MSYIIDKYVRRINEAMRRPDAIYVEQADIEELLAEMNALRLTPLAKADLAGIKDVKLMGVPLRVLEVV